VEVPGGNSVESILEEARAEYMSIKLEIEKGDDS
jgi:hypothetical protein